LTHLQVRITTFGDEGCRTFIDSGALRRLEVLDLGYGNMTDEGARLLAACPDLKHLSALDVTRNALTASGIAALRDTRIQVVADNQRPPINRRAARRRLDYSDSHSGGRERAWQANPIHGRSGSTSTLSR
jgi:hypothetical protein